MSVHPQQPGSSGEPTYWEKCILCQKVTSEVLQSPARLKHGGVAIGEGYSTLSSNIICFIYLNELFVPINIGHLDKESGFEALLLERKASGTKCAFLNSTPSITVSSKEESCNWLKWQGMSYCQKVHPHKRSLWMGHKRHLKIDAFFCETLSASEPIHELSTLQVDTRVCNCSHVLLKWTATCTCKT